MSIQLCPNKNKRE